VIRDEITGVDTEGGRVRSVRRSSGRIETGKLVLAPGPFLGRTARQLGLELPVSNRLHARAVLTDPEEVVPTDAPLMIWCDPVELRWTEEEREALTRAATDPEPDPDAGRLMGELPAGVRVRPRREGESPCLLIAWQWKEMPADAFSPPWPPELPPRHGEVLLRGLARMIPGLERYFGRGAEATVDGGYDCRTPENRPLIGPLPVAGAYVLGALSSYAVMASQGAAELLSAHVAGEPLPSWAPAFHPGRYDDPGYRERQRSRVGQPVEL
jgi:glycine/D-amino acid oxidase-like deaminating enzyme